MCPLLSSFPPDKGKNLIIIQLEGMDNWIVNKNDTPNIYKMMNNSINFTKHYSFYNGGGSTFNSEFAINTGYVTPFSYTKNLPGRSFLTPLNIVSSPGQYVKFKYI